MSANPYAPSLGVSAPVASDMSGPAVIRRQYLSHEASVKSAGILYYIAAVFLLILSVATCYFAIVNEDFSPQERAFNMGLGIVYLVVGILQGAAGYGLRRLQRWSKPIAIVLSILGLFAIPLGTIINGYILYLLVSRKGSVVFSDHYQHVIAKTPDIKYRSSFLVLLLLAILITVAIVSIVAAIALV